MEEVENKTESSEKTVKKPAKKRTTSKKTTKTSAKRTTKKTTEEVNKVNLENKDVSDEKLTNTTSNQLEDSKNDQVEVKENKDKVQDALEDIANSSLTEEASNENETISADKIKDMGAVFYPLEEIQIANDDCEKEVENKRINFQKVLKQSARISRIGLLVTFAFLIAAVICMFTLQDNNRWISFIFIGAGVICFIVMMVLSKRQTSSVSKDVDSYVIDVLKLTDSYYYMNDERLKNVEYAIKGKLSLDDLTQGHYFDTIINFNSRNVVTLDYDNKKMTIADVAVRNPYQVPYDGKDHSQDNPRKIPAESYGIFGKYISYPLTLKENTSLIITMQGTNCYLPTFTDGYVEITSLGSLQPRFKVWTTNNVVTENLLANEELTNLLNSFEPDDNLENMFISINSFGLKVALNYNETVMEVPTQVAFKGKPYLHYKEDFSKVIKLIDLLK